MRRPTLIVDFDEKPIIDEIQLRSQMAANGLCAQRVHLFFNEDVRMTVVGNNDIESFISLTESLELKTVFYEYFYLDKEEFLITGEMIERYDEEIVELLLDKINEYNSMVEEADFSKPAMLKIFAIHESYAFGISMANMDLFPIYSCSPTTKLSIMIDENEKEVVEIQEKINKRDIALKEELKRTILNDEKFSMCKNQTLRMNYLRDLLSNGTGEKYRYLFAEGSGYISNGTLKNFIELVWNELKLK